MRASRTIMIAVTAGLLTAAPATATATVAAASADTVGGGSSWGPTYAPGKKSVAKGTLTSSALNRTHLPATSTVAVKGRITDLTSGPSCGWAVFRISYRTKDGNVPFKHRSYLDCSKGTPRAFSFTDRDVALVELKVCGEGRAAEPSNVCLYAGTWKTLYSSL
ncbi:hypothetical protein GCM10010404_48930 [Nonomuraea africana]|uniref:Uncharacterized protein n=1 Tax=Nonomuraea africana TaxID=46171 RepID=A0ABR9KVX2_9ACTN|nr:hypothetical protein [Nonomuraea africana]MBE1566140.1 hypothetical protein [Nonomuraea africana]